MANPSHDVVWERWEEVDDLFGQALDLAVEERPEFLAEACSGDSELLDTLSRLLDSAERGAERFAGPGSELLRAALADPTPERAAAPGPGTTMGSYRLLREIGRGGMARVFEAERADGAFDRRVAIKVLGGVDSAELGRRFVAERQILSSLSHPHIARLLDGGTADDGRPFLVMELVEGESLVAYADRSQLGVTDRLELFTQVIEAVQYAHTRLVVHRDIKPSNVLVEGDGGVRLLDFGIARLLDEGADPNLATRPATRWMTPEYAAPEQILARPITTATDVHALGVLLYELLTGHRPFGGTERRGFELERAICEEVPAAASTPAVRTSSRERGESVAPDPSTLAARRDSTPERLRRRLSGDLDAILAKCLRKDPEERYHSAQELYDDLRRHLSGFPVLAREGLMAYRAKKFVGRHRVAAAVAAVAVAGFSTFTALLAAERNRAAEAAALAATEAENAQLIVDFLADVFRGRDPNQAPADTFTARELLEWGVERVDVEFADRPELQADLFLVLGDARRNLGNLEEAVGLIDQAVALRAEALGPTSPEVAEALVRLGETLRSGREFPAAEEAYTDAIALLDGLDGHEPMLASALTGLSSSLVNLRQPDTAEVLLRRALALRTEPGSRETISELLQLAVLLRNQGKLEEAEAMYVEGIPAYRLLPDREDGQLAIHLNNLGYLRRVQGDWEAAQESYSEALRLMTSTFGRGHPNALLVASNLAGALDQAGQQQEALEVLKASLAAAMEQWPEGHWRVAARRESVGDALLRLGRRAEALPFLADAGAYYELELGTDHDWTSFAFARIAVMRLLEGDVDGRGRAFLDRLHTELAGRELNPTDLGKLESFLFVLRTTGPQPEYDRFRSLHPDSVGTHSP